MSEIIPQPPTHLFGAMGNIPDLDPSDPNESFIQLHKLYGPIYKLELGKQRTIVVSSYELVHEVSDDKRFEKSMSGALIEMQSAMGDGLFTSDNHDPTWKLAHRLLMPVFGPIGIRKMYPQMLDIASQLLLKWDHLGDEHEINVSDEFTRLAFDTIGLCAFNYRFNDFYSEQMHPFATWMSEVMIESGRRSVRTRLETSARIWSAENYRKNNANMHRLCDQVVADRKAHPRPEVNDLLNVMLSARDPETGQGLSDENIRFQMATFLIAGHETTSATLSFCMYELLKNPAKLHTAQKEVDEVVGDKAVSLEDLPKLKYVDACLKETLRFRSPIRANTRHAQKATTLGGRYAVEPDDRIIMLIYGLHRDPKVWGDDADTFRPERMLDGNFERLPPDAWKPFGTGMRACIGRVFAIQEMQLMMTLLLQRFNFEMADASYELKIKSTLTVKPDGFKIKVRRRAGRGNFVGFADQTTAKEQNHEVLSTDTKPDLSPIAVYYGSNSGSCKSFADELRAEAATNGFRASVQTMDTGVEHLLKDQPVVIITPSYEGEPPDNGKLFVSWLEAHRQEPSLLKGVSYAVFGAGNSDWATTFHRIPMLVNQVMQETGAQAFHEVGLGDAKEDLLGAWDTWKESLWKSLRVSMGKTQASTPEIVVTMQSPRSAKVLGGENIILGTVRQSYELCGPEVGLAKRHMEVELPKGLTYQSGDYLSVLPFNDREVVSRVIHRFELSGDDHMLVSGSSKPFLPTETSESVFDFLMKSVELRQPSTQSQIRKLAAVTDDDSQKSGLERYASDDHFSEEILATRKSLIDLLEEFPACTLQFSQYLDMLKQLSPRQYSISSSPLANPASPNILTISYDVYDAPALFKRADGSEGPLFHGVASTYLARMPLGGKIRCAVRPTNIAFHLPSDPRIPIIMISAGTGIAPMRGFIQERAAIAQASGGATLGPAILYFGCRDANADFLYEDQLKQWEGEGVVKVRPTFSRGRAAGTANGVHDLSVEEKNMHKYVSDRIWDEREEVRALFRQGAKILLCGSASKVGKSVKDICCKIYMEGTGCDEQAAREWLRSVSQERFVGDLFS